MNRKGHYRQLVDRLLPSLCVILTVIACQQAGANANRQGDWRWWDEPGRGNLYIARTPSLVFQDSYLTVYFDGKKNCAPFLALAFHPANPDKSIASLIEGQQIEVRVDQLKPILFRTAVAAPSGDQLYFLHPLPENLLDAIAAGNRLLARSTLAPQIDVFSLNGSAASIRKQQELCQIDPAGGDLP